MPFETITDPEHINTHRLSVERPERNEKFFDPKKEITPEDWEGMKTRLEGKRNSNWYNFAALAADMSELSTLFDKPAKLKDTTPPLPEIREF